MARKIVHQLIDDLDGTLIDVGSGETVLFSLDGVAYETIETEDHKLPLLLPMSAVAGSKVMDCICVPYSPNDVCSDSSSRLLLSRTSLWVRHVQ